MIDTTAIRERHTSVKARIAAAAARAGRPPEAITLVAVTKTWPAEWVLAAHAVGMGDFGENRAEELAEKRVLVDTALGPSNGITWHLIGTLQSRKTHLAATHADVFHALDRGKIARRLSTDLAAHGRRLPTFLEVKLYGEASKAGLDCTQWEDDATQRDNLRSMMLEVAALPGLDVIGLMTMAPWDVAPSVIRAVFRRTYLLSQWLRSELPADLPLQLSMGMSDDFEIAIEEGSTHVRVGRALFGERA